MADRAISDLNAVTGITTSDLFVCEQNNQAMSVSGQVMIRDFAHELDGHGGIKEITGPVTTVLDDVYTIVYTTDMGTSPTTFTVHNGKGISQITGPTTSGLNDTYTIKYNDNTTSTFVVKNGRGVTSVTGPVNSGTAYNKQKHTYTMNFNDGTSTKIEVCDGAKGAQTYVWIRYSTNQPTKDADMHTTADNYIGIYSGTASTAPTDYTSYTWYKYKGETGNKGDDITVSSTTVEYANGGSNGTTPPTSGWQNTAPSVQGGKYLWSRIKTVYSDNSTTYSYAVAYQGVNGTGTGTVTKVNNVSDVNGNVTLTGSNIAVSSSDTLTLDKACRVYMVTINTITSLPKTQSDSNITSDMVCVNSTLTEPNAQYGDWQVDTANGSVTISGAFNTDKTTDITLYLMKKR